MNHSYSRHVAAQPNRAPLESWGRLLVAATERILWLNQRCAFSSPRRGQRLEKQVKDSQLGKKDVSDQAKHVSLNLLLQAFCRPVLVLNASSAAFARHGFETRLQFRILLSDGLCRRCLVLSVDVPIRGFCILASGLLRW